jgi:hypothetical protein
MSDKRVVRDPQDRIQEALDDVNGHGGPFTKASGSLIWCWRRKRWYRKSFPNQKFTIHRIRSEDTHGQ